MAHNIAMIDGRRAMAYQGKTPWHTLGTPIERGTGVAAALDAASLNWNVVLEPLYVRDGNTCRPVENRKAVIRETDRAVLSTVGRSYAPIQYPDAFGVFAPAIEKYGLTIETAGALGNGEKAWMLFRLPMTMTPVPGDHINGYGVAIAGHDGKTMFQFRPTPVRVVCQNTLNAAVGAGGANGRVFGIPHVGDVTRQVGEIGRLVDGLLETMKETGETFSALARRRMRPAEVVTFIESVFPNPDKADKVSAQLAEKRADVAELVWRGPGADLAMSKTDGEPNPWACYNAVTAYFDHVVTARAQTDKALRMASSSAVFGRGADVKLRALRQAQRLVAA